MTSVIVQSFSSRFETPRAKISQETFETYGIEVFNTEKIPFADRTGPDFAKNLVTLLTVRIKKLQKIGRSFPNGIHIYELGAGTGLLAKRILDLLKSDHKEVYSKLILHLSDISKKTVTQLEALNSFKNHKGHITFEVIDAVKPKFANKPLLVYFTNLIDSIPYQRHILIKNKQIFEMQIQTSIKKGAQLIDAINFPPKVLEEKEIAMLLSSTASKRCLILAPQILTVLEEETKPVPINEVKNIHKEELEDLNRLNSTTSEDRHLPFNYSYPIRTMIRKILQEIGDDGFLFFSDFGITSSKFAQSLYVEFGSVTFFTVDFPSLAQLAKTLGKTYYLTANQPGYPQEMLIDTNKSDKQIENLFKKDSIGTAQTQVHDFIKNVKAILASYRNEKNQVPEKIKELYQLLPREAKIDYFLLNELSLILIKSGFYKEANSYANIIPKHFAHSVGVIYYLVKGKYKQEQGQLKAAEKFFKDAIAIEGQRGYLAYVYLGELYWLQKRYLEYIDVTKKYLTYTRMWGHLRGMISIAAAQEKHFGPETARKTLKQAVAIGRKLKILSDSEKAALNQAEQWLTNNF